MRFDFNFNFDIEPSEIKQLVDIGEETKGTTKPTEPSPIIQDVQEATDKPFIVLNNEGHTLNLKSATFESTQDMLSILYQIASGTLAEELLKGLKEWGDKNGESEWVHNLFIEAKALADMALAESKAAQQESGELDDLEDEDIALSPINLFNNAEEM